VFLKIKNRIISEKKKPLIVFEISANHQKSKSKIYKLINEAKKIGAEAIKFQTFRTDEMTINSGYKDFVIKSKFKNKSWNNRSLFSLYKQAQFPFEWHKDIFDYAKKKKLICFSSVFDQYSLDFLERLNCPAYKIASLESLHYPLIKKVCETNKPLIVSTGTLSLKEIDELIKFLKKNKKNNFAILHCVTEYPASYKNLNLKTINYLKKKYKCIVGFSDHSIGIGASIASISYGANIIEKHYKLKNQKNSLDSSFSASSDEMKLLLKETENAWLSLGVVKTKTLKSEKIYRKFIRSIYSFNDIKKGELFTKKNIKVIRPGNGLMPKYFEKLLGKKSPININKNRPLNKKILKRLKIT
tara:strand:+ start:3420 stop:4490 length:1071 start_codon:yes stop_codon:yes gene_type:complete